jgi:hypothetical protein
VSGTSHSLDYNYNELRQRRCMLLISPSVSFWTEALVVVLRSRLCGLASHLCSEVINLLRTHTRYPPFQYSVFAGVFEPGGG